ncbi:hypothetical protein [Marinitenerispora sediminis]|uniref:Uncharacterized protein n=1 Tax=Marinitenerispora sediminis TaxID=1931232 RepID=A0A368T1U9_9ACTN|nr:hypothetical protein [Marinitenerispora sediminis]RCV50181.1 hypothetical protein DEF23_22505 [Marinitenerispora sediminis]RCV54534.1 hypothetical protein DEF24_19170 [Marinitenerispora sediminis]RCV56951.1 hypothetical protein DEF28_02420 [Marinitenerispora sediminis]
MSQEVPKSALDLDEILRRGGANVGDEDFAFAGCPGCGRVFLFEGEADALYLDPHDLGRRHLPAAAAPDLGPCPSCGERVGYRSAATWAEVARSAWVWAVRADAWPRGLRPGPPGRAAP